MDFNRVINGMMRAMRLDKTFFEEVEHDPSYNQDALAVVVLVAIAGGIGGFLGSLIARNTFINAVLGLIVGVLMAVIGYFIWVYVAQFIGTRLFKGQGDVGEVQRAFGFAYAPQILGILSFIPCLGGLIALAAWIWSIAAGFVAIRQSLDQDNQNAALTVIVSAIAVMVITALIGAVFGTILGIGAVGIGAITGAFNR
jgi:hypothetical protein